MEGFEWFKKYRFPVSAAESQSLTADLELSSAQTKMAEGELYSELLEMTKFANYYPHVFPDQSLFY